MVSSILGSVYLKVFGIALFAVGFNIFLFLEKIKNKIKEIEDKIISDLKNNYKEDNMTCIGVVDIYKKLTKSRLDLVTTKNSIDSNLWSGITFLAGTLIGFIFELSGGTPDFALFLIFSSGLIFAITFVILIYWYIKKASI